MFWFSWIEKSGQGKHIYQKYLNANYGECCDKRSHCGCDSDPVHNGKISKIFRNKAH
jgi:hypothetical protein